MFSDHLSEEIIRDSLSTALLGCRVAYFRTATSTMDEARKAALESAPEGTLVLAEEQTGGKGRFQRRWVSPPGVNLYLSLILRPQPSALFQLGMVASLALARGLHRLAPGSLHPTIKWPNDVRLGGKKVGGILIDSSLEVDGGGFSIVGVGVNVNLDPGEYPDIRDIATSVRQELGHPISRLRLLGMLLEEMEQLYIRIQGGDSVRGEWSALLDTLGRQVRVAVGGQVYEGYAQDVDEEGSLILLRPDGSLWSLAAGEVTLQV
ncbi:MAG: biotin/acetyl-CoA-carboxylase ligase [Dehalococcoidia bacterium]|nr:biotin/acetyl-CoA-carboxylase ligase [Dehalococcoidia bacterium]